MSYPFADPSTRDDLPPLRIHHFMLWTAVAAVMLTVLKTEVDSNQFSMSMNLGGIPSTLIYSVCLTGLALGLYWKHRGLFFFDEPGQMAFVLHGIFGIYSILSSTIASYVGVSIHEPSSFSGILVFTQLGWFVVGVVQLVLYFRYAKKFAATEYWGKFFRTVGMLTILQYLLSIIVPMFSLTSAATAGGVGSMMWVMFAAPVVLGIIELYYWIRTVRHDIKSGNRYHWTHWVGAATWPAFRLVSAGMLLLMLLFVPVLGW